MSGKMQKKILIYQKNSVIGSYHEKTNLKKMHSLPKEFTEDISGQLQCIQEVRLCSIRETDILDDSKIK